MHQWHRIANNISDLQFGSKKMAIVVIDGRQICIARHPTGLFAFTNNCPHAGGKLSEGFIDSLGNIVCPVHHYRYNLKTGRDTMGEGYFLKTWPVEIREEGVYVGIEKLLGDD